MRIIVDKVGENNWTVKAEPGIGEVEPPQVGMALLLIKLGSGLIERDYSERAMQELLKIKMPSVQEVLKGQANGRSA